MNRMRLNYPMSTGWPSNKVVFIERLHNYTADAWMMHIEFRKRHSRSKNGYRLDYSVMMVYNEHEDGDVYLERDTCEIANRNILFDTSISKWK